MAEVVVLANQIPMPIKVAWILWLVWTIVQVGWFRRARIAAPVWQPGPALRPERRRVVAQRGRSNLALTPKAADPGGVLAGASDVPRPPASAVSGSGGQREPVGRAEVHPALAESQRD